MDVNQLKEKLDALVAEAVNGGVTRDQIIDAFEVKLWDYIKEGDEDEDGTA